MTPRQFAAIAGVALLTSSLAARSLPPSPAAVGDPFYDPTLSTMTVTPTSLKGGLAALKIKGHDYDYAQLSATCPEKVWLKLGSTNLCTGVRRLDDDNLEHVLLRLRNPNRATGTIVITAKIVEPKIATSTATQKSVSLKLLTD